MAKITEIRLTLAAFIYAIEIDIKNIVKKYVTPYQEDTSFFHDADLEAKVLNRFSKDNPGLKSKGNLDDVID
jgi:LuxR family glucitol operon transcriptional activator